MCVCIFIHARGAPIPVHDTYVFIHNDPAPCMHKCTHSHKRVNECNTYIYRCIRVHTYTQKKQIRTYIHTMVLMPCLLSLLRTHFPAIILALEQVRLTTAGRYSNNSCTLTVIVIYVCIYVCIYVYVCMYICGLYVCMYIRMHAASLLLAGNRTIVVAIDCHVCMCYIYVCICGYMYVCMYLHVHTYMYAPV